MPRPPRPDLELDRDHDAALALSDDLVQHLATAKYALSVGDTALAMDALDAALALSRASLGAQIEPTGPSSAQTYAGRMVRKSPAAPPQRRF
jgi:hypothetical protein